MEQADHLTCCPFIDYLFGAKVYAEFCGGHRDLKAWSLVVYLAKQFSVATCPQFPRAVSIAISLFDCP